MKNIIITGTSRGIGFEMAQLFAKSGHNVLAISRKKSEILSEIKNITCLEIDLSNESDFSKIAHFLHIINNPLINKWIIFKFKKK